MCYKGKCLYCIEVETGALIFGVFSAVVSGILTLFHLGLLIAFNYVAYRGSLYMRWFHNTPETEIADTAVTVTVNAVTVVMLLKCLLDFIFSTLLCNGISKKNKFHVKAYFIYGVVMAVFCSMAVIGIFFVDVINGVFLLMLLVIYFLLLHMVNMVLKKMSSGEVYQFQHKLLTMS